MGSIPRIPWPLTRIDKEADLKGEEITLDKFRRKYGTFQCRCVGLDRIGRKKYNNRIGVQTDLGDIEISLWKDLVRKTIASMGETDLYNHYFVWISTHEKNISDKDEREQYALEGHIDRLFDDPCWEDFVPFNRKYRPKYLAEFELVRIKHLCCNYIEEATRAWADQLKVTELRCRRCSKTAPYKILECEIK